MSVITPKLQPIRAAAALALVLAMSAGCAFANNDQASVEAGAAEGSDPTIRGASENRSDEDLDDGEGAEDSGDSGGDEELFGVGDPEAQSADLVDLLAPDEEGDEDASEDGDEDGSESSDRNGTDRGGSEGDQPEDETGDESVLGAEALADEIDVAVVVLAGNGKVSVWNQDVSHAYELESDWVVRSDGEFLYRDLLVETVVEVGDQTDDESESLAEDLDVETGDGSNPEPDVSIERTVTSRLDGTWVCEADERIDSMVSRSGGRFSAVVQRARDLESLTADVAVPRYLAECESSRVVQTEPVRWFGPDGESRFEIRVGDDSFIGTGEPGGRADVFNSNVESINGEDLAGNHVFTPEADQVAYVDLGSGPSNGKAWTIRSREVIDASEIWSAEVDREPTFLAFTDDYLLVGQPPINPFSKRATEYLMALDLDDGRVRIEKLELTGEPIYIGAGPPVLVD